MKAEVSSDSLPVSDVFEWQQCRQPCGSDEFLPCSGWSADIVPAPRQHLFLGSHLMPWGQTPAWHLPGSAGAHAQSRPEGAFIKYATLFL